MLWWKLRKLRSKDFEERRRCVDQLGEQRDLRAVPHLIRALEDPHRLVAVHAAIALGAIGDPRALAPLIAAIPRLGSAATEALAKTNRRWRRSAAYREALPRLLACLTDRRSDEALSVSLALVEAREPAIRGPLLEVLSDPEAGSELRSLAIREADWVGRATLGSRKAGRVGRAELGPMLECLLDPRRATPELVARLDRIDRGWRDTPEGSRAISALVARLGDQSSGLREEILRILEALGDPHFPDWLAPLLADSDPGIRWLAGEKGRGAWKQLSHEGVCNLVAAFAKNAFPEALQALAAVEDRLRELLHSAPEQRYPAALALAGLDRAEAIPPLLELLRDPRLPLWSEAPTLLRRFEDQAVFEALAETLLRPEPFNRHAVIFSLAAVGGPLARSPLEEYLARPPLSDRAAVELALQILPPKDGTLSFDDRVLLRRLTNPWRLYQTREKAEVFEELARRFPSEAACEMIARELGLHSFLVDREFADYCHLLEQAGRNMDPEKLRALVRFEAQNWPQVSRWVAERVGGPRL